MAELYAVFTRIRAAWRGWLAVRSLRSQALRAAREQKSLDEESLRSYIERMHHHPDYPALKEAKEISMLHEDVLVLLYHFAATSSGAILEIGSYVGGSTVALGMGVKRYPSNRVISMELGGRYAHPQIPSDDISADLQQNLARFGVLDRIDLLNGSSRSPEIVQTVTELLGAASVELLFVDADGYVGKDFDIYQGRLKDGALLVFDDYQAPGAPEKEVWVKKWVDSAVAEGRVKSLGVWGWGTWIGIYLEPAHSPAKSNLES